MRVSDFSLALVVAPVELSSFELESAASVIQHQLQQELQKTFELYFCCASCS